MTTINQEEIQKFSKLADQWWDANGKFKPLHAFNPIRIKYIINKCTSHFKLNQSKERPLSKLKILDIGCGGGLVCEPLSRLGADVTGIDASSKNIEVAKIHAKKSHLKILSIHPQFFVFFSFLKQNTSPERKTSGCKRKCSSKIGRLLRNGLRRLVGGAKPFFCFVFKLC